jgi:hypothetical protein
MFPESVPPSVPVPVLRVSVTVVVATTLADALATSWLNTVTLKGDPACGLTPPFTLVITSFAATWEYEEAPLRRRSAQRLTRMLRTGFFMATSRMSRRK